VKRRRPGQWGDRIPNLVVLERQTLPQRAAAEIRKRVLEGRVRSGGRLEPMRRLAADLGVSLPTIREAIAQLQGEGLIDVRHGVGCMVVRRQRVARALKATTRRAARREIAEMRVVIDPAVAGIAAQRATPARIRDLLSAMWEREAARRGRDPEALVDADIRFHRCVAEAARGPVGIAAHRLASSILRPFLRAAAAEHYADDRLAELHRALAEAIGQGRAHRAVRAARAIALIETRPS
jgi:GntR family transcriptional repressor for pyruvate dehydrogenase complex